MTMIKNLIFDFGNVLVSYDFMAFLDRFFGDDKEREEVFAERPSIIPKGMKNMLAMQCS